MSRRITSNNTSLITGKIHRRVFRNFLAFNNVINTPIATPEGAFSFGLDNLPRRPNYVWAAEVVRINFQWQDNVDYTIGTNDHHVVAGVATITSSDLATWLTANTGPVNFYRRDEIIAVSAWKFIGAGAGGGVQKVPMQEVEINMTDLMGQGVLVFGNNMFLIGQTVQGQGVGQFVTAEIWFKYVEVPLEYYLSTQQDLANSGV